MAVESPKEWLANDPDPETRAELAALLAAGDEAELADRFSGFLQFGTAGLRGELGAGPNRMNRAVVIRTAAGLAAWLRAHGHPDGSVVIGYDARHKSDVFARDTAAVLAAAGLRPLLLPRALPTPVLAFAIRWAGAVAGVQVTASHNPPRDNGYKVYLGDGVQIVPPVDAEIAAAIDAAGPVRGIARADLCEVLDESVVEAYLDRASTVLEADGAREVSVVYTPLHGVGRTVLGAAFARCGFPPPAVVPEQAEPDPDFPTLPFPNPEEPGALDLAYALAESLPERPDVVIANDPDADRCAVAVPLDGGAWRMLRGDELGALLATRLVERGAVGAEGVLATTIVSSALLRRIAERAGAGYAETLTGFKWLARVPGLRFGYEEALGYCVDPAGVADKDGITAALQIAEYAAELRARGERLTGVLDRLAAEFGRHTTDQLSLRVDDPARIGAAMRRLREAPPKRLGGFAVTRVEDLLDGAAGLPPTDGLRLTLERGWVVIRPSGTEPKLKCYFELVDAPAAALAAVKSDLGSALAV
ncbi:phosphomannomutase [Mangrovactinospora gilvigrisea]|uniref:Phosphomannomutase n=1 Tax=Mangrovactinospora gilvigrisea TaxID=1428644 RepID=A0A1J7BYN6_9ACTN|nr:phospho-sugar mutase [Mangrovactinospora gilvigrisea]OIV38577.1 phosphomannomutase [Mangrovactinospora gilvigrisea]